MYWWTMPSEILRSAQPKNISCSNFYFAQLLKNVRNFKQNNLFAIIKYINLSIHKVNHKGVKAQNPVISKLSLDVAQG